MLPMTTRVALVALAFVTLSFAAPSFVAGPHAASKDGARVFVFDDEVRVRRGDAELVRARGRDVTGLTRSVVELVALRGESAAFQVVVLAGPTDLREVTLRMGALLPADGSSPRGRPLTFEIFREHYLRVDRRSANEERPGESLGWTPGARPPDERMRGDIPDALIPVTLDATPVAPGPAVPAGRTGAFWADLHVPEATPPGAYVAEAQVDNGGNVFARFSVRVVVRAPVLPYRVTGAFVYYEAERLDRRMGDGAAVERQLWQLLHAHHLDALAPLKGPGDVARLSAAYDGSLFREDSGYAGPGSGVAPSVVALGSYGILGDPRPDALARVDAMAAALPAGIEDVFLYAVDEQCDSPRGAAWRAALAGRQAGHRVRVGWTCAEPPETQPVDIALLPGHAFPRAAPAAARAAGKRAWIYNGALPRTGTLLLDAEPRGLVADGWIAAAFAIDRWFYWESIFWDDDNKGGRGAIDPFTIAETFHNADGDAALGDGLLLYPGRQLGPFAARSLGLGAVLPSLRLKALRRGIEDAALIALAARDRPDEARRIVLETLPRALDEASPARPASWDMFFPAFTAARAALRALVTSDAPLPLAEARAAFAALAAARPAAIPLAPVPRPHRRLGAAALVAAAVALGSLVTAATTRRRRSARRESSSDGRGARTRRS